MKKVFIVALDTNTTIQNNDFKEYIKENGFGWWYWIDGFWLLTDSKGKLTSKKLREKLNAFYPNVTKLVIEADSKNLHWSGFGPRGEKQNMFDWLHDNI